MKSPLKYRILDAGAAWFGLLGWQAEPFYYATTGWIHSLFLLPAMRRREPPARPDIKAAVTKATDEYLDRLFVNDSAYFRKPGETDNELRDRINRDLES